MTYKQIIEYYEDDCGDIVISIFLSDSKAGLFSETFTTMSILNLGELKESVEISSGQLAEDEISFTMNDISANNDDNISARTFLLEGLNVSNRRYIGIFIHYASEVPDETNFAFYGVITPDAKANDLYWSNAKYGTSPAPYREWSFTARPLATAILDEVLVKDCINEIEEVFWTDNALDRDAFYNDGTIKSKFSELINLNIVIQEICNQAVIKLADFGFGSYSILCPNADTNCSFRPTRYINRASEYYTAVNSYRPWHKLNDIYYDNLDLLGTGLLGNGNDETQYIDYFPIDDTDVRPLVIGFETIDNDNSPYVSQRVFRKNYNNGTISNADFLNEYDSKSIESTLCYDDNTTLTEWLFNLAYNFGFFLRYDYLDNGDTLVLLFEPRILANSQTYIPYITSADIETNFETQSTSKDNAFGKGFYWTAEGRDVYIDQATLPSQRKSEGKRLYFTISPNFKSTGILLLKYDTEFDGFNFVFEVGTLVMPHNFKHVLVSDNSITSIFGNTTSAHTGIYMKVGKYDLENTKEATEYFTTAGQVTLLQNDNYQNYATMSSYVNGVVQFDGDNYKTTYSITLPYIMSFSLNSDGSDKNFQALGLLNNVVIDGVTYKIVDITRNFQDISTQINLHNASRFDFSSTLSELNSVANDFNGFRNLIAPVSNANFYAVSGQVVAFNVVEIFNVSGESFVRNANPYQSSYPYQFAMALISATESEVPTERVYTNVALNGETVYIDWLPVIGNIGDKVYLCYGNGILNPNITTDLPTLTPLDLPALEHPLWCEVGTIIGTNLLLLQFRKFIIETNLSA